MSLDRDKRRAVASRAARYLQDEEVEWVRRYWIVDYDALNDPKVDTDDVSPDKDTVYAIGRSASIGRVREWLREHSFGARNRRCGVCAEGALLLALAEDPTIPDDVIAGRLLDSFEPDSEFAADKLGFTDDYGDWDGIAEFNDDMAGDADEVIRLLDAMRTI